MWDLPTSVTIDDTTYDIRNKGDYRMVLDVIDTLNDVELTNEEKVISALMIFYEGMDNVEDVLYNKNARKLYDEMNKFMEAKDNSGYKCNHKIMDWKTDENLIVSGINGVIKQEVRALPYLHWWTFISYYLAIKDGALSYVVGIREKMATGKKLEKAEREFVSKNPNYFTFINSREQQEQLIKEVWNVSE